MIHTLAVDYQTDWSLLDWWIHFFSAIAVPVLAGAVALVGALGIQAVGQLVLPNLPEATLVALLTVGTLAAVALGAHWHIELLYDTLRHTSSTLRAALAALFAAGALSSFGVVVATTLGVRRGGTLAVIALAITLPAAFSMSGDALARASIATATAPEGSGWPSYTDRTGPDGNIAVDPARSVPLPRSPPRDLTAPTRDLPCFSRTSTS